MAKRKATKRRARSSGTRRRHHRRRRSLLSAGAMTLPNAQRMHESVIDTLSSGAGGLGAAIVNKYVPSKGMKIAVTLAVGILGHAWGMPNVSSGFVGGSTALMFPTGQLSDDANFADDNVLADDAPIAINDDGQPVVMSEDGEVRLLSESEIRVLEEQGVLEAELEDDY